jgi:acylphosphatase
MRRRFVFSGRVQGVGFRATARHIARNHPLSGWVRNDPDGTVTLELQGHPDAITRFIDELRRSLQRHIDTVVHTDIQDLGDEDGFRIVY